jgi:two-component system sensor histidine kinase PilS (NtrC family)
VVESQELARKLSWLMAIRLLVVASVLLPAVVYSPTEPDSGALTLIENITSNLFSPSVEPGAGEINKAVVFSPRAKILQVLVGAVSLQTLLYVGLLRLLRRRQVLHAYVQLCGDILLISLLLYKFGSITANISVLYFVVIGVAAFLVRREASLITAAIACVCYATIAIAHQSDDFRSLWRPGGLFASQVEAGSDADLIDHDGGGWWPRLGEALRPPSEESVTGVPVGYNISVHFIGFLTVALFSGRLARDPLLEQHLAQRSRDLAHLQVLHRDVIQSISSGLITTDLAGRVTSLNRAAEEILGLREANLLSGGIREVGLFAEESWEQTSLAQLAQTQARSEVEMIRKGRPSVIGFTVAPLRDTGGAHRGYLVIFQDLTEWRALEEKVKRQDRMAAMGQMAAGLAHEVGNPLAAIAGSVQMLAGQAGKSPSDRKLLDITLRESRRLDRTVKSFLQFARPRERQLQTFDAAALLADDVALLRNSEELRPDHEIEFEVEPGTLTIEADRDQVGQIFWNLVRNALQAMPQGGKLSIAGRLAGDCFELMVRDSGKGMNEEERNRLFQPFKSFFDGGIGLGMAIVYRIVQEHEGDIRVASQPGAGTTITVSLPIQPSREEEKRAS